MRFVALTLFWFMAFEVFSFELSDRIERWQLKNGMTWIVIEDASIPNANMYLFWRVGSRNEYPGITGLSHFFEHMMFRGTDQYSSAEYAEIIKNAGGDQNAYTTDDYTNYFITFNKAELEQVLAVEADRFQNLKYTEEQFRTEAQAVKGEYLKNFSNPILKMLERLRDLSFQQHTYKHTTMGFFADIEAMPDQLDYSKVFFDRWYRPEKSTVILVGDLDPDVTVELVEKYFQAQDLFYRADRPEPVFDATVELDLATVVPSLAGPKRSPARQATRSRITDDGMRRLPLTDTLPKRTRGPASMSSRIATLLRSLSTSTRPVTRA